ncbi:MAG: radical SAM protein [Promethearchaeota archaeon]
MTPPTRVLLLSMPDQFLGFWIAARLPNLGLVSMAGNRDGSECEVGVVDLLIVPGDLERNVKTLVDRFHPDLVGLNCMTFQFPTARRLAKFVKEEWDGEVSVAMGGYHPSLCVEELVGDLPEQQGCDLSADRRAAPWVDYVVRGEGEHALRELVHALRGEGHLRDVAGLSWRGPDGRFRHNPPRPVADLSTILPPDRSARLVKRGYHAIGKPADVVETSRGCTNACKFCSITAMYGRGIRFYDLDRVVADVRDCADRGAKAVLFIDDNITLNAKRFEELCDRIVDEGLHEQLEFHTQASASGLLAREPLVEKMGKANFSVVFFGIENLKPRNLAFMDKRVPVGKLKRLVRALHDNGMISFGGFIFGNPDDGEADFWRNVEFARYLDLDFPAFQIMVPFPKTGTREDLMSAGLVSNPHDYAKYTGIYANVRTRHLEPEAMERLLLRCYYRYYTPGWFFRRLRRTKVVRKHGRYVMSVVRKYAPLALRSWLTSAGLLADRQSPESPEDQVLERFRYLRDSRTGGL